MCHLCGGTLDEKWECSHVLRLSRQSTEQEEVIRAACAECHAEQTAKESIDDTGWAPMTSVFCRATWEQFCRQEREPPINLRPTELSASRGICGGAGGTA